MPLPCFVEAWELARDTNHHAFAVDAAHMVAIARPSRSLEWNQRALEYAETCGDERAARWRGALYNNIGWTWHDLGGYDEALAMFKKDFVFRVENKDEEGARIAKWSIARTLRSLGRYGEALDMQRDLALEFEQLGRVDGYVHEELGELLLAMGAVGPLEGAVRSRLRRPCRRTRTSRPTTALAWNACAAWARAEFYEASEPTAASTADTSAPSRSMRPAVSMSACM